MARASTRSHALMASAAPTRAQQRIAFGAILVSLAVFGALLPVVQVQLTAVPVFVSVYQTALICSDLLTAALLYGQYRILGHRGLCVLACGYLFTAQIAAVHALSYPGLILPGGVLGGGPQTTVWLYMLWHGGFPLFVMVYAYLRSIDSEDEWRQFAIVAGLLLTCTLVFLCGVLTTAGHALLPEVMAGSHYTLMQPVVVGSVLGLSALALLVLWRRRPRTVLDLWLMVVMFVWLIDIALSAYFNAGRFDVGFYFGRVYGLASAFLLLFALVAEHLHVLRSLHDAELILEGRVLERTRELEHANAALNEAKEAAEQSSLAKSTFVSRLSQELRSPLHAMLGFARVFASDGREPSKAERQEFARVVSDTSTYLLDVVNSVLDLEAVEAGALRVMMQRVPLTDLLRECEAEISPLAARRALRLAFRCTEEFAVQADRERLKQVLMILLSNGVQYNRDGGLLLVACVRGASGRVRISVEDNGRGLSASQIAELFQPFRPLDYVRGRLQGPGIGLALARSLVELMGGQVGVTSAEGAGSSFWIDLASAPVAVAPAASALKD